MNEITPIAITDDTVTLSRADYDRLMEELADAQDLAASRAVEAAVEAGEDELLPAPMVERLLAGEHPVRVWREHRGITGSRLAAAAGITQSYLSEIETRRKPGSFDAMVKLARALDVSLDELA
jgi:hypothetical protein